MIDVTFQLLIFFIVTMKIKQKERREVADLPQDEGPNPLPDAEQKDFIVVRLFWKNQQMIYEVNVRHGNKMGEGKDAVNAGPLDVLIKDRADPQHTAYERIFNDLLEQVRKWSAKVKNAKKFELSMSLDSTKSSGTQIADTAPWGYVTLALDVLTKFNQERTNNGQEPLGVTFKNTEPDGAPARR